MINIALLAVGGVLEATRMMMEGTLDNAFCAEHGRTSRFDFDLFEFDIDAGGPEDLRHEVIIAYGHAAAKEYDVAFCHRRSQNLVDRFGCVLCDAEVFRYASCSLDLGAQLIAV